jgi:hypothetical protein
MYRFMEMAIALEGAAVPALFWCYSPSGRRRSHPPVALCLQWRKLGLGPGGERDGQKNGARAGQVEEEDRGGGGEAGEKGRGQT